MARILFVAGDDRVARATFREHGRGYWTAALPLVLEKHGLLGIDVATPDALNDPRVWDEHDVILIGRLPEDTWTTALVQRALRAPGGVIVEGPAPPVITNAIGMTAAQPVALEGAIQILDDELRSASSAFGFAPGGWVSRGTSRPVARDDELDWTRLGVPIGETRARAWRASAWEVQKWDAAGSADRPAKRLADWISKDDAKSRFPAIVQRDGLVVCCFDLFSFLGQSHTVEPFEGAEFRNWPRTMGLEVMLLGLIDMLHERAGQPRARIAPWPSGVGWVLNVRHDVDRPLAPDQARQLVARHAAVGTAATWYWRSRYLPGAKPFRGSSPLRSLARRLTNKSRPPGPSIRPTDPATGLASLRVVAAQPGHEVAHHTELLWAGAEQEEATIELARASKLLGAAAHGDPHCFRFQGAPNVLWSERQGHSYTEFIGHAHFQPHRFAALGDDGRIETVDLICLPHHESFDRSTTPGDTAPERIVAAAELYGDVQGFLQILNHPDINNDELFEVLDEIPRVNRIDWTAAEASDWWRRTHIAEAMVVRRSSSHTFEVRSTRGAHGVELEVRMPGGRLERYVLNLEPGAPLSVEIGVAVNELGAAGASQTAPPAVTTAARPLLSSNDDQVWEMRLAPRFADAVRSYYDNRPGASQAAVATTVRTNSELVAHRSQVLLALLGDMTGVNTLVGRRVAEIGAGFGALAAYFRWHEHAEDVTGIDVREDFVAIAQSCAVDAGLSEGLSYLVADMRDLAPLADASCDVLTVNNAFVYLTTTTQMNQAITAFARVLAPGGVVLLYHANRWRFRDPFTRAPLIHLAPPRLARAVGRITGWKDSRDRVRLTSAGNLARMMRSGGFADVRVASQRGGRVIHGRGARLTPYYAVAARKPG